MAHLKYTAELDRMLVGNQIGEGLTRSTVSSFAPFEISHPGNCPHGSESPVVGTGHPGLYPGWRMLPTMPVSSHKCKL